MYTDDAARKAMRDAYNYIQNDRLIKTFFVNLCLYQFAADPWAIFQEFKVELCSRACRKKNVDVNAPTDEIINDVLLELKELFEKQNANMEDYITAANMPTPKPKGAKDLLIETNFDPEILAEIASTNEKLLNEEQSILINTILKAIDSPEGGLFSAEASGARGWGGLGEAGGGEDMKCDKRSGVYLYTPLLSELQPCRDDIYRDITENFDPHMNIG